VYDNGLVISPNEERTMSDLLYILLILLFFAACYGLVLGLERLRERK
jgi:hypothetical protein